MNKEKFEVMRDNYNAIAPRIGHDISSLKMRVKYTGARVFDEMELARDNIGKVCFIDTFEKKRVPEFFFQIGNQGFLSHLEMDRLSDLLPRFLNY